VLKQQQGYLMIVAVLLIMVIGFLGTAVSYMLVGGVNATSSQAKSTQSLYLAESALEQATYNLLNVTIASRSACSGLSLSSSLGAGAYSLSTTGPFYVSSPTTLNGALIASATTLTVASTSGYQSSGRIQIDKELMNYASVDSTHFIGVTRGVDGSVAAAHATGAPIGQYQCNLSAQGGVPDLTTPQGKRLLKEGVQLQEAWAVGNSSSSNLTFLRWNKPTEVDWSNASIGGAQDLNGIFMLSYVDGWAVGQAGKFLHWDGSAWSLTTVSPSIIYQSVYCSASNDCHAVGASSGSSTTIVHWDGSTWSRIIPIGTTAKTALRGVHCDSSNDCWTVGSNTGGGIFYQWNGSTWTGVSVSTLTGFTFNGVFCNSSTDCWAVGGNAQFARKSGTSWAGFATGLPSATYNSVFCNSSTDCWAVGNTQSSEDLIVHWNGTSWSRDTSNPTPIENLTHVVCANSKDCWAVGANAVFVHWNGSTWSQFTTSGLPAAQLNAVSIVSPGQQPESAWQEPAT